MNTDLESTPEFLARLHEATKAMQQLVIVPSYDQQPGVHSILVDAKALASSENDVRLWRVEYDSEREAKGEPGMWAHWPSNQESYRLGDVLLSIAFVYTDKRAVSGGTP